MAGVSCLGRLYGKCVDARGGSPPRHLTALQEEDRGDTDVLECDTPHSTLYVNEPKQKVDLTKFIERHTFRCVFGVTWLGQD